MGTWTNSKICGGKIGNSVLNKAKMHINRYQLYKKMTRDQHRDYAEDTNRFDLSMQWYEVIRSTLEDWRNMYPNDAEVIADVYALGDVKRPMSATEASIKHNYSQSTIYSVRHSFDLEVAFRAVKLGLIIVP